MIQENRGHEIIQIDHLSVKEEDSKLIRCRISNILVYVTAHTIIPST